MSQKHLTLSSGRVVREPGFETEPEVAVERSLQREHRDTKFLFNYSDTLFSCSLNCDSWPINTSTDSKLSLKPGERCDMFHRDKKNPKNCLFLGRGSSKSVAHHQKVTLARLKKGLPAQYVPQPSFYQQSSQISHVSNSKTVLSASSGSVAVKISKDVSKAQSEASKTLLFQDPAVLKTSEQSITSVPPANKSSAADCKSFQEFMKSHEQRMKRARDIAIEVKRKGDKRRRYQLREAEEMVSFCQKFFCLE